jgi:hypothetical protein
MSTHLYALNSRLAQLQSNQWVKKLEHGDADSSGSTLRTLGIVILVVLIVGIIGYAVQVKGAEASATIIGTQYDFTQAP